MPFHPSGLRGIVGTEATVVIYGRRDHLWRSGPVTADRAPEIEADPGLAWAYPKDIGIVPVIEVVVRRYRTHEGMMCLMHHKDSIEQFDKKAEGPMPKGPMSTAPSSFISLVL